MKKVLFATTALVASAGIASAQGVTLSGSAELGIIGGESAAGVTIDPQFHTDIDVTFTMSGETDNGLTFGASVDLDESDGAGARGNSLAFGNTKQGGETIFISGSFGTLTMGDTDGAFDWALTEAGLGTAIADDHTGIAGYNGNAGLDGTYDGQIARYDYSFGNISVGASAEVDDTGVGDPVLGIGAKWSGDLGGVGLGIGAGYQTNGVNDIWGASAKASISNVTAVVNYSDLDGAGGNQSHIGAAASYTWNALTVAVTYGTFDRTVGANREGYGAAIDYDLGGGAALQLGYGHSSIPTNDYDTYSLGVAMSF